MLDSLFVDDGHVATIVCGQEALVRREQCAQFGVLLKEANASAFKSADSIPAHPQATDPPTFR